LKVENFDYPSVNVIAKVDGTDPKLKGVYVLAFTRTMTE
jgi:hypothetical protein